MMRRVLGVGFLVAGFSLLTAGPISAQFTVGVGAAGIVGVSDYGDHHDTGWGVSGTLGRALNDNASIVGVASYGSNGITDTDDKTNLLGLSGNFVYFVGEPGGARPFVVAGLGILGHQYSPADGDGETDWQASANGGAGLSFPLGSALGYVIANYTHGFDETTYVGLGGGVAFLVGGN